MRAAASDGEVYVVWTRDGEWGDTRLASLAHRSAASWCNEQRKLLRGDPVQWKGDTGKSANCVLLEDRHGTVKETMYYTIEAMRLAG